MPSSWADPSAFPTQTATLIVLWRRLTPASDPLKALQVGVPGNLARRRAEFLRAMTQLVEVAKRPPDQWQPDLDRLAAEGTRSAFIVRFHAPPVDDVARTMLQNHAMLRCSICAAAAERFRRTNGRWPVSLGELVTAGLLRTPTDPYDGQPVRLKRVSDGLVVYTVGPDKTDDGGNLSPNPTPGTDCGLRLWDVPARRQPPRPPTAEEADHLLPPE